MRKRTRQALGIVAVYAVLGAMALALVWLTGVFDG